MRAQKLLIALAVFAVVLALMTQEVDARRKILKGRKTVTRTYYTEPALPAWAIILLVSIGEILLGGIVFLILKRVMIDKPQEIAEAQGRYSLTAQDPLRS